MRSWPRDLLRARLGGLSGTGGACPLLPPLALAPVPACHSAEAGGEVDAAADAPRPAGAVGAPASCQVVPLHSLSVSLWRSA